VNVYVYTTARGKVHVVNAADPQEAWRKAAKHRHPSLLLNTFGAAWTASAAGGCVREPGGDVNAGHVAHLIAQAAEPLSGPEMRMLRNVVAERPATWGCRPGASHERVFNALRVRGLVDGNGATDAGRIAVRGAS
jgi:hypothetical protein